MIMFWALFNTQFKAKDFDCRCAPKAPIQASLVCTNGLSADIGVRFVFLLLPVVS